MSIERFIKKDITDKHGRSRNSSKEWREKSVKKTDNIDKNIVNKNNNEVFINDSIIETNAIDNKKSEENKTNKKNKNNKKNNNDMNTNSDIEKINNIMSDEKFPEKKVKIEKKERGLFERTGESTTILTEDNKMLLND